MEREGIAHGRLEMIEYDSKTVGTRRKMQVYTPPGYSTERKYPVLYCRVANKPAQVVCEQTLAEGVGAEARARS